MTVSNKDEKILNLHFPNVHCFCFYVGLGHSVLIESITSRSKKHFVENMQKDSTSSIQPDKCDMSMSIQVKMPVVEEALLSENYESKIKSYFPP